MTAPGYGILFFVLTLGVVVTSGYAVGRMHQWYRHGREREEAYRNGYDKASRAIADRTAARRAKPAETMPVNPPHVRRTVLNQRQLYPEHEAEDIQFRTSR